MEANRNLDILWRTNPLIWERARTMRGHLVAEFTGRRRTDTCHTCPEIMVHDRTGDDQLAIAISEFTGRRWTVPCPEIMVHDCTGDQLAIATLRERPIMIWKGRPRFFKFRLVQDVSHKVATCMAFHPYRSDRLVSGGGFLTVWGVSEGIQISKYRRFHIHAVEFDPTDGQRLFTSELAAIDVWDFESERHIDRFTRFDGWPSTIAVNPTGTLLAAACVDGVVMIWDTRTHKTAHMLSACNIGAHSIAFHPNGNEVAAVGERTLMVWSLTARTEPLFRATQQEYQTAVTYDYEGRRLLHGGGDNGGDNKITVRDALTPTYPCLLEVPTNGMIETLSIDPGKPNNVATAGSVFDIGDPLRTPEDVKRWLA